MPSVHEYRLPIIHVSVFDLAGTWGVAHLLTMDSSGLFPAARLRVFAGLVAFGIAAHVAMGVPTVLNSSLGLSPWPVYNKDAVFWDSPANSRTK